MAKAFVNSVKPIHKISADRNNVYADGLKIGYHFPDGNGYFVNLIGDVCKGFPSKPYAMLWIAGFAEKHIEKVRQYLITKQPSNHNFVHIPIRIK